MAQKTIIVDDIDGTEGAEPVTFSFEGIEYTIDLSAKNRGVLDKVFKPYVAAAASVGADRPSVRGTAKGAGRRANGVVAGSDLGSIRSWAAQNGIQVNQRGRIPNAVLAAYRDAR